MIIQGPKQLQITDQFLKGFSSSYLNNNPISFSGTIFKRKLRPLVKDRLIMQIIICFNQIGLYVYEQTNKQPQEQNLKKILKEKNMYLGHCLTPSSPSLDSGGFFSTVIPSFSVAIVCALTLTDLRLLFFDLVYNEDEEERTKAAEVRCDRTGLAIGLDLSNKRKQRFHFPELVSSFWLIAQQCVIFWPIRFLSLDGPDLSC